MVRVATNDNADMFTKLLADVNFKSSGVMGPSFRAHAMMKCAGSIVEPAREC